MPRILSLMFHRIHDPLKKDRVSQFEQFLKKLVKNNTINNSIDICLTFDDAYYDFYHYVYPLLKKFNMKALLAVPVKAITEDTQASPEARLASRYIHHATAIPCLKTTPLCTWKELKEMADSGHVAIASHGYQHADLTLSTTNLREEVEYSKNLLEQRLNTPVDTFVYPYGRMSTRVHQYVRQHYTCAIRIGSAYNFSWNMQKGLIYRMDADPFWKNNKSLHNPFLKLKLTLSYCGNRLRKK